MFSLHHGDCLTILKTLPDHSIDSIVTDPPAGISFMGKDWDSDKGGRDHWIAWMTEVASECRRVIKPGGHALVWALPRTSHWTATAWEDGGWSVRDRVAHLFATGYPKSRNIGNDVAKMTGTRTHVGSQAMPGYASANVTHGTQQRSSFETPLYEHPANEWDGWHTSLKPAVEDWWLFRAPLSEKTVVKNVLEWGTGALNIDACRIAGTVQAGAGSTGFGAARDDGYEMGTGRKYTGLGRWPANFIHDGSDTVLDMFAQYGESKSGKFEVRKKHGMWIEGDVEHPVSGHTGGDTGTPARFFQSCPRTLLDDYFHETIDNPVIFCPKASKRDRAGSRHPTIKPLKLLEYLVKLITPPGGVVLDCFAGSGSTGEAALSNGFAAVLIEREAEYIADINRRLAFWQT